jgi:hypothetical protein
MQINVAKNNVNFKTRTSMMNFNGFAKFASIERPERRGPDDGEKDPLKPTGHLADKSVKWLKCQGYRS